MKSIDYEYSNLVFYYIFFDYSTDYLSLSAASFEPSSKEASLKASPGEASPDEASPSMAAVVAVAAEAAPGDELVAISKDFNLLLLALHNSHREILKDIVRKR